MAGLWDELGIAPTTDASTIRRAYAARLKAVRPDADPQGFARLRGAYEQALAASRTAAPPRPSPAPIPEGSMPDPGTPGLATPGTASPSTVLPPEPPPPPLPAPEPVAEFLRRGDVLAAAEWLATARATGTLGLAADLHLADRLGWTMAQDRALPAQAVRAAAGRLGWPEDATAEWAGALRARLDAERWLEALRRDAACWTRWLGAAVPIVARILLGRGGLGVSRIMASDPRLKQRYGEYLLHAPMVGDQFDPARVEAVGRLLTRRFAPLATTVLRLLVVFAAAGAAGALTAKFDPQLQDGVTGVTALVLLLALPNPNRRRCAWLRRAVGRRNRR